MISLLNELICKKYFVHKDYLARGFQWYKNLNFFWEKWGMRLWITKCPFKPRAIPHESGHEKKIEKCLELLNYKCYNDTFGIKWKSSTCSVIWAILQIIKNMFTMKFLQKTWFLAKFCDFLKKNCHTLDPIYTSSLRFYYRFFVQNCSMRVESFIYCGVFHDFCFSYVFYYPL